MTHRDPITHELKIWPEHFDAVQDGRKPWECRNNLDRDFRPGDTLHLREWNPRSEEYTDRELHRTVTHLHRGGQHGIAPGFVVMTLEEING